VLDGAVLLAECGAGGEAPAHDLALDRSGDIHRQRQVVVLVDAGDRARTVDAQEVQADAEVLRQEVRHAHRRGLVRHAERVAEVLDGEVAILLRLGEEGDRRGLGHEAAGRVVVDLEPLLRKSA
jgi:hypothetical protein